MQLTDYGDRSVRDLLTTMIALNDYGDRDLLTNVCDLWTMAIYEL